MANDFLKGFLSLVLGKREHWGFEERRRGLIRLRCNYKCLFSMGEARLPCTITDLGEGGLGLASEQSLPVGQKLRVFCPFIDLEGPCGAVDGQVCWTRWSGKQHLAGLSYTVNPDTWVQAVLDLLGFHGRGLESRRKWVRADCTLPGRLEGHEVQIHNLGVGGALVEGPVGGLTEGERTLTIGPFLKLEPLQVDGRITHLRDQTHYGFEFHQLAQPQLKLLGLYLKALLRRSL